MGFVVSPGPPRRQVQVANDVAPANELPSREPRPGGRVNNSPAAGKRELRQGGLSAALSVAGFSMTHIKGSKCAMISRALSTSASPSARRQRAAVFRADRAGPNHVEVPRRERRVVPAPDVAQDGGLKFRHDVQGDDLPAASKALPTDLVPQKSSRSLGIFKEQDHRRCDDQENSRVHRTGLFSYR